MEAAQKQEWNDKLYGIVRDELAEAMGANLHQSYIGAKLREAGLPADEPVPEQDDIDAVAEQVRKAMAGGDPGEAPKEEPGKTLGELAKESLRTALGGDGAKKTDTETPKPAKPSRQAQKAQRAAEAASMQHFPTSLYHKTQPLRKVRDRAEMKAAMAEGYRDLHDFDPKTAQAIHKRHQRHSFNG